MKSLDTKSLVVGALIVVAAIKFGGSLPVVGGIVSKIKS